MLISVFHLDGILKDFTFRNVAVLVVITVQPKSIVVTVVGMVKFKLEHPVKAARLIDVTLFGMVKVVKLLQSLKACGPIEVTVSGIVMVVNLESE